MTPTELEELVRRGDATRLATAMESLRESERRKLSTSAAALFRELDRYLSNLWNSESQDTKLTALVGRLLKRAPGRAEVQRQVEVAQLATFGLCPISVTRRVAAPPRGDSAAEFDSWFKVLSDRRPDWIDDWVEQQIQGEWPGISWDFYWQLKEEGICQRPAGEAYYRFMASQLSGWAAFTRRRPRPLSEMLTESAELREDMWKLFEIDTVAFSHDWGESKDPIHESWPTAIHRLATSGVIDRGKLLDATLRGQTSGLKTNLLSGFAALHDRLEPTIHELAERQAAYADLLGVKVNRVVSFAMKHLKRIDKAGLLDDEGFVTAAESAFAVPTKGPAKSVLSLYRKIGRRAPERQGRIVAALVNAALLHPSTDIVAAAVALIGDWKSALTSTTIASLTEALPDLPATVQPAMRSLLAETAAPADGAGEDSEDGDGEDSATTQPNQAEELGAIRNVIASLDARWCSLAGVHEAMNAIEQGTWPGRLRFAITEVPVLTGLERLPPIESIDELRDVIAHDVEQVDTPLDFERILDGICRFGRATDDRFERLAAPLIKRIRTRTPPESARGLLDRCPREFTRLIGWWLAGAPDAIRPEHGWPHNFPPLHEYLNRRCLDLRKRLEQGIRGPLLSFPTHEAGWVEPSAVVARWRESVERRILLIPSDVSLTLLRLAPDARDAALTETAGIEHPWAPTLRWALGSQQEPPAFEDVPRDIWLAASTARGEIDSPAFHWHADLETWKHPGEDKMLTAPRLRLTLESATSSGDGGSLPALALPAASSPGRFWHESGWMIDVLGSLHPARVAAQWAEGLKQLMSRIDDKASAFEPNHPYFRSLFEVDRPLGEIGCLLLIVGLNGKDQDSRGMAIDAAIEAIQDGRLHPDELGPLLASLSMPGWLKLNRVCPSLFEVARVGAMHAWVVFASLQSLLAAYDSIPRDGHHLLSLLLELAVQLGSELNAESRETLANSKAGGKTARLAKALLQHAATPTPTPTPSQAQARLEILQARVDRAARWSGQILRE